MDARRIKKMPDQIDKTLLFLERQPKGIWIELDKLRIKDIPKFIELVKACIDINYQAQFNDDYTKLKILDNFPLFK